MRLQAGDQDKAGVRSYFEDLAAGYDDSRISEWQRYFQGLLIEQIRPREGLTVLDVGCGTGWAVREVARRRPGAVVHGIDISPGMIKEATRRATGVPNVTFSVGDAEHLELADETFDYVITSHAFRHCPDPRRALAEFHRVLGPDGCLLMVDFCRDIENPALRLVAKAVSVLPSRNTKGFYSSSEMVALVASSRFRDAELLSKTEKFMFLRKLVTSEALIAGRK
jgi:ubiquinone/menaquinone biosynthesis C-methylase UbiE